jgi:selenocysteine-specific elongation factor
MQVIATAGHVDHGKSTLLRALTGMEPDRWAEERRRGMTIGLGFVWTRLPGGRTVAFVDVPGHERFVDTMLAGVGPAPAVLFVVAADEGWMPQSEEHLDALDALGTRHGLLVITRSDRLDPELALTEASERLAGSSLAGLDAVCVSATTGAGMDRLRSGLATLLDRMPKPDPDADVRLWVDRAFTIRGAGTVVTGTLAAGRLRVDDQLVLEPGGRPVRVRGLQSLGQPVAEAIGVARVAVNLRGLARQAVAPGAALLTPDRWYSSSVIDVRVHPVHPDEPLDALPRGLTLHLGAAATPVALRPLAGSDPNSLTARLTLRTSLPLHIGDRALLRDPGGRRIVAGLTVLDVAPPELRRRGAAAERARELTAFSGTPDAAAELTRRGVLSHTELRAMGADPNRLDDRAASRVGDWLLDPGHRTELAARLLEAVAEHNRAQPLDPGLPLGVAGRLLELPEPRLLEAVVASPPAAGRLTVRDGRVCAVERTEPQLPPEVRTALDTLRAELAERPFVAPESDRLAALGLGPKELAALVRTGALDRLGAGVYLLPGAEQAAVEILAALPDPEFTLSTARQALGTSRRVAVPLLALLARHGRTRRTEDGRHRLLR